MKISKRHIPYDFFYSFYEIISELASIVILKSLSLVFLSLLLSSCDPQDQVTPVAIHQSGNPNSTLPASTTKPVTKPTSVTPNTPPATPTPTPSPTATSTSPPACDPTKQCSCTYPQLQCSVEINSTSGVATITIQNISQNNIIFDSLMTTFNSSPYTPTSSPWGSPYIVWQVSNNTQSPNTTLSTPAGFSTTTLNPSNTMTIQFSPPLGTTISNIRILPTNSKGNVVGPVGPTPSPTATSTSTPTGTPTSVPTGCPATTPNSILRIGANSTTALSQILSENLFNAIFSKRNSNFTYSGFIQAASMFPAIGKSPGFMSNSDNNMNAKELAAFLANTAHETTGGWVNPDTFPLPTSPAQSLPNNLAWGLYFIRELCGTNPPYSSAQPGPACDPYTSSADPTNLPIANMQYFGRGPIQLSWNYNYGSFSKTYYGDNRVLLCNPDLVATDSTLTWATAIYFWMTAQAPKPSAHDVMMGNWTPNDNDIKNHRERGFGTVINIINGGLECGLNKASTDSRVQNRIDFYTTFQTAFGLTGSELENNTTANSMTCNNAIDFRY